MQISTIQNNAIESRRIYAENSRILNENLYKYKNNNELIDDSVKEELLNSAREMASSSLDRPLSCEICELLQKRALQTNDRLLFFQSTCGIVDSLFNMDINLFNGRMHDELSKILEYRNIFFDLSLEEKKIFHESLSLYFINIKNKNRGENYREILETFEEIIKFWTNPRVQEATPSLELPSFVNKLRWDLLELIGDMRHFNKMPKDVSLAVYDAGNALYEALGEELLSHFAHLQFFYHAAKFHLGKEDATDLLDRIESLVEPLPDDPYGGESLYRVFIIGSFYANYVKYDDTEKRRFVVKKINERMIKYIVSVPNSCRLKDVNISMKHAIYYLLPFLNEEESIKLIQIFILYRHLPTYVHSKMVNRISQVILKKSLDMNLDLFKGYENNIVSDETREKKLSFLVERSCLIHDIGKISCLETVSRTGRKLTDREYEIIKSHPLKGVSIIDNTNINNVYVEVTKYHHTWYANTGGYPYCDEYLPINDVIDLIAIADSIDAATDCYGRTYSKEKSLKEVVEELKAGAGTRYSGQFVDLLNERDVLADLEYIISDGRSFELVGAFIVKEMISNGQMKDLF